MGFKPYFCVNWFPLRNNNTLPRSGYEPVVADRVFISFRIPLLKILRFIGAKLYIVWTALVFSVFMLIYLPFIVIPFTFGRRGGAVGFFFLKVWSKTFSVLNAIRYDISGKEKIDSDKAYIYVCNHSSYLDLPGICLTVPAQLRPLAKKELKKIPVFGWIAQRASVIIDRSSKQSRKESIVKLRKVLDKGISILIFPEGHQNRSTAIMQPFYDGAFRLAIETGCPILPLTIINSGKLMPPKRVHIEPGTIKVIASREIATDRLGKGDIGPLKQKVYDLIERTIREHRSTPVRTDRAMG